MPDAVSYYRSPERFTLTVKVLRDSDNICRRVAETLFRIACHESPQPGLEGRSFEANLVYEFANGLVFRLFDDGLGINDVVLEFYVPEEHRLATVQILSRIPRLLRMADVEEAALRQLKHAVTDSP